MAETQTQMMLTHTLDQMQAEHVDWLDAQLKDPAASKDIQSLCGRLSRHRNSYRNMPVCQDEVPVIMRFAHLGVMTALKTLRDRQNNAILEDDDAPNQ